MGVFSPFSPVSHEVARRSAPAMVVTVEDSVSLAVQDVWCIGLQPTVRRNIPVRTVTQPRSPMTVLQLRTGSGSVGDASIAAISLRERPGFQVKTNRAWAEDILVSL